MAEPTQPAAEEAGHPAKPAPQKTEPKKPAIRYLELRIFFSLVCLLVIVARAVHPTWFDDALDYVPIGLAALPWLGFFVTEVKLPGGIEAKLAEIEQKAEMAEAKAQQAKTEIAEKKTTDDIEKATLGTVQSVTTGVEGLVAVDLASHANIPALAARYNDIRRTQPPGSARTVAMTAVLREMVSAAASDAAGADFAARARGDDEGLRLAAAAWAVAHAKNAAPSPLVDAFYDSGHAFTAYWVLMALNQIAEQQGPAAFSADMIARLQARRWHAAADSDRAYLLDAILRKLGLP